MDRFLGFYLVLLIAVFGVACTPTDNSKQFEIKSTPANLQQRQSDLQKLVNFDLSKVIVARLKIEGKTVDVTSMKPVRVSSFKSDKGLSVTLLVFDKAKENLIFFSQDSLANKGYEHKITVEELKAKQAFSFPVIDKDGALVSRTITPISIIIK